MFSSKKEHTSHCTTYNSVHYWPSLGYIRVLFLQVSRGLLVMSMAKHWWVSKGTFTSSYLFLVCILIIRFALFAEPFILTSGYMFGQGLYRKATDLLKAPSLNGEGAWYFLYVHFLFRLFDFWPREHFLYLCSWCAGRWMWHSRPSKR